ncbi:DUF3300 domain-containing protein [Aliikangiella sp. IMCC44653]
MKNIVVIIALIFSLSSAKSWSEANSEDYFSEAQLEQILAPIALYPDSVLTHILIASTYPLEVVQAHRWLEDNANLSAAQAIQQTEDKDWDLSVKALVPFPRVLERLSKELDWMQSIGDAFIQDEERVLASIQSLRRKADEAGSLSKMENTKIIREERQIIIQPVEIETIYIPYYDTRVVYGNWYWHSHPPVYWDWHWGHRRHYSHTSYFYWHPRVYLSHSHHYHFSAFNWRHHHVVVLDHRRYAKRRYHRTHIIRHENARRWQHNPKHRRGVAYRTEVTRNRYASNRPSQLTTKQIRSNEHQIRNKRQDLSGSRLNTKIKADREQPELTRQQRIKQKMRAHSVDDKKSLRERKPQERLNKRIERDHWRGDSSQPRQVKQRQVEKRQPIAAEKHKAEQQKVDKQRSTRERTYQPPREVPVERSTNRARKENYNERNSRSKSRSERAERSERSQKSERSERTTRSEARASQRSSHSNRRSDRSTSRERR